MIEYLASEEEGYVSEGKRPGIYYVSFLQPVAQKGLLLVVDVALVVEQITMKPGEIFERNEKILVQQRVEEPLTYAEVQ